METLKDKIKFKLENRSEWDKNTEFWLSNPLRQVVDTRIFFNAKLKDIVRQDMVILDMGCGSSWLLDFLLELNVPFSYIGVDFNPKFITHLKNKYAHLPTASFETIDLEEDIPEKLLHCADIVFNCFNFFEIADLSRAFDSVVALLKPTGKLIILTIDVTYLILAMSHDMEEFKSNLKSYEEIKLQGEVPYFFQNIDLGNSESKNLKYASVLYSLDDFFKQAKKHELFLCDYGEIIKTSKFLPKIYQYIVFKK